MPYRLGFSPQPQQNILVSHPRINPAPWKCLIYTNPAQGFLPDRLQITPKIPVFQSRTPKFKRYFCARSHPAGQKTIFLRGDIKSVRYSITNMRARTHTHTHTHIHTHTHTHKHKPTHTHTNTPTHTHTHTYTHIHTHKTHTTHTLSRPPV